MKKLLLFSLLSTVLFSCKQSSSPKETAQTFIKSLATSDLATASSLVSSETKSVIDKARKEQTKIEAPDESFQLSTLTETIADRKAEVKNNVLSLSMIKEEDGWKVVLDEGLLNAIQQREEQLSLVKAKWNNLQKEYEGRLTVAKAYVDYKKSVGTLSPQVKALSDMVAGFPPESEWTKEKLLEYVQKQQQLSRTIDAALEPSLAANTDLSLNYFLQISTAGDRIKAAEAEYQAAAHRAHSPVYVPLPFKTASDVNVNHN